ncbi:hypothetical protein BH10BAC4_BH10BAC4_15810 [soil metagenome]
MKGLVKNMPEVLKSQRLLFLKVLFSLQIAFLAFLFFQAVSDNHYYLVNEDEVINFCSAKVFSETGSVRAEGCIAENVSRIGEMNWYGPGYSIIYGAAKKFFGDSPALFIKIHFVWALFTLAIIFLLPVSLEDKLLSGCVLLFAEQFTGYIFTYFPESFHLLAASVFILLIVLIDQSRDQRKGIIYAVIFTGLALFMVLFRVTAIFWITALIGLSQTRKTAVMMILVFMAGLVFTLLYMRYFTAPPYAADMQKIDRLFEFDVIGFVVKTIRATGRNTFELLKSGSSGVYGLLMLMLIASIRWWQTKDRLLLAALLVSSSLVGALMAYYSAGPWYFLKQSAILIPLLIIALIITGSSVKLKYGIFLTALLLSPFMYNNLSAGIQVRRNAFSVLESNRQFHSALLELREFINEKENVTILWCYDEFDYGPTAEALLPFATTSGFPILYTSNIVKAAETPEVRFQLHNKLKVQYVLSRSPLDLPSLRLVHATQFYHFYKIEK